MINLREERMERGEQQNQRRKRGHEKRREPEPPLAPTDILQIGFRLLRAKNP